MIRKKYLITNQSVEIQIHFGLDTKTIKAVVLEYLGNDEYVVEGENGNRYIRKLGDMYV